MIKSLFIENFAIIEQVSIDFSSGFSVLTGETGAGKSIIIDAINMVLGERSSREVVRTGTPCATVIASFSISKKVDAYLKEQDIDYTDDELLFERKIFADGKSTAKLNSRPVNLVTLKELGGLLLNIHGQHDSQHLLSGERHIEYLDSLAKTTPILTSYKKEYEKSLNVKNKIRTLKMDEKEKNRKLEILRYQCEEISMANLQLGEDDLLNGRKAFIQNSEKIASGLIASYEALNAEERENALSMLSTALHALAPLENFSDTLAEISAKVGELYYALVDVAEEVRIQRDEISYEPGELDEIEERLNLIYKLKKKYGNSMEELLTFYENASAELTDIALSDEKIIALENELKVVYNGLNEIGTALSKKRKEAAISIEKAVASELHFLNMPAAKFQVFITPFGEGEHAFSENGMDRVEFLIATNKGDVLRPLAKIVSGGELSRICLALKNILGKGEDIETLIFDEIDTGVSGSAAEKIGLKLRELAQNKQVLCVTHLSQIAALAKNHFLIEKQSDQTKTTTAVKELDYDARVLELARIISGAKITETAMESAKEMLL